MALHFRTTDMPGLGFFVENIKVRGRNGNAAVAMFVGQLVQVDWLSVATITTDTLKAEGVDGGSTAAGTCLTGVWQHVTTAGGGTVAGAGVPDPGYILGIVTSLLDGTGAAGQIVEITISGRVKAYVDTTAAAIGKPMVPDFSAVTPDPTTTASVGARLKVYATGTTEAVRVVARVLEPVSGSAAGLYWVLFDGGDICGAGWKTEAP